MSLVSLMDSGPLVAFLSANDTHHRWAVDVFAATQRPAKCCEAVVSEACFLVGRNRQRRTSVLNFIAAAELEIVSLAGELPALMRLMDKYASLPMSFADACLVRLAELNSDSVVLTTDADFKIYRKHGRQVVRTRSPA